MNQFLKYSLEKQRKIRAVLTLDGVLVQKNVTVLVLDAAATTATLQISGKKEPLTVALADILSCDYARGDHGDGDEG